MEVAFSGLVAAQGAAGNIDGAALAGRMGIAKEGLLGEMLCQLCEAVDRLGADAVF